MRLCVLLIVYACACLFVFDLLFGFCLVVSAFVCFVCLPV